MGHIYAYVSESDGALKQLQSLYKLKIDNMTQGLAIQSFETRIPKFFAKNGSITSGMAKSRTGTSYFDQIPSFRDWDEPMTGFRDRLKEELRNFESTHTRVIEDRLDAHSKAFIIAKLAVTESVTWILQLIMYMDDTYKDLIRHYAFTVEKAWQLTTQLVRKIFMEVSLPRQGMQNLFTVGDNAAIGKLTFWPIVKAHDVMKRYKDSSFKDDPTIASEYVKFLAANSGSDTAEKVVAKVGIIESELKTLTKSVAGLKKGNGQGLNKVDDVQKRLSELQKRVAKLEGAIN
jgi:hypothetical protein